MAQPQNVRRYRPGVVPEYGAKEEEKNVTAFGKVGHQPKLTQPAAGITVVDKRLQRLNISETGDHSERLSRHKRIIEEAAILGTEEAPEIEVKPERRVIAQPELISEEEAIAERRRRIEKALELQQANKKEESEEEDDEGESEEDGEGDDEYDSDESEDEQEENWGVPARSMLIQPRFVPKENRQSIADREKLEAEEDLKRQERMRENEERKNRTLAYLKEDKAREAEAAVGQLEDADVDTDDEEKGDDGQSKEFEEWQLRELHRIRRDREARERIQNEKSEIEARRAMTDEEVMEEKKKLFGNKVQKKVKFLQKYYHKGAFYSEELAAVESKKEHDWTAPTGEDRYVDKTDLPAVLQVKNFGRSSRTKYTHLKNEDTSNKGINDIWKERIVPERIVKSLGGAGTSFDRPTKKRKIEAD